MHRTVPATLLAAVLSLAGGAALAQQPAQNLPPASQPANNGNAAPAVVHRGGLEKTHGGWRASQILGATVYSDQHQGIGGINDLIIDPDGKVKEAVISVGGFLGIGSKLVGVPYDQLHFEQQPIRPAATTSGAIATPGATTSTPTTTNGTPAATAPAQNQAANPNVVAPATAPAAAGRPVEVVQTEIVLPGATKDSLTAMPDFKF